MKTGGIVNGEKKKYHKGCGAVMAGRRKQTKYRQEQIMKSRGKMRSNKKRGGGMLKLKKGGSAKKRK